MLDGGGPPITEGNFRLAVSSIDPQVLGAALLGHRRRAGRMARTDRAESECHGPMSINLRDRGTINLREDAHMWGWNSGSCALARSSCPFSGSSIFALLLPHGGKELVPRCCKERKNWQGGQAFALAMADDRRLYQRSEYSLLHAPNVTFLAIDDLRCHGVIRRDLSEIFMVKALTCDAWPDGPIDLLGHLF